MNLYYKLVDQRTLKVMRSKYIYMLKIQMLQVDTLKIN